MKTLKLLVAACIVLITISAGMAQSKTEVRKVNGFDGINVGEGIEVSLTMAESELVEVTADTEIINNVVTELDGTTLSIHIKGNNIHTKKNSIKVKVNITKVKELDASSGSSIVTTNLLSSDNLEIEVSSGANAKIAFKSEKVSCDVSSGASANLKGVAKEFVAEASSGATLNAEELVAAAVNADVSSGATIICQVETKIDADASSGGSIKYKGNPTYKDIEKSSGGSVSNF